MRVNRTKLATFKQKKKQTTHNTPPDVLKTNQQLIGHTTLPKPITQSEENPSIPANTQTHTEREWRRAMERQGQCQAKKTGRRRGRRWRWGSICWTKEPSCFSPSSPSTSLTITFAPSPFIAMTCLARFRPTTSCLGSTRTSANAPFMILIPPPLASLVRIPVLPLSLNH